MNFLRLLTMPKAARGHDGALLHCHCWFHPNLLHHRLVHCLHGQRQIKGRLLHIIHSTERVIGCNLPSLKDLHDSRALMWVGKTSADPYWQNLLANNPIYDSEILFKLNLNLTFMLTPFTAVAAYCRVRLLAQWNHLQDGISSSRTVLFADVLADSLLPSRV